MINVAREKLWDGLRKSSFPELYVKLIQDMYAGSVTTVTTSVGTEEFNFKAGLHQGSAFIPFLFSIPINRLQITSERRHSGICR